MNAVGEGHHEDCLRAFLRLRVRDLGGLLPQLAELVRQSISTLDGKSAKVIPQANQVVLVCALSECWCLSTINDRSRRCSNPRIAIVSSTWAYMGLE